MYDVIVVTGSRNYPVEWKVSECLTSLWRNNPGVLFKVGDCPTGVDKFTTSWHNTIFGEDPDIFHANWNVYGNRAGPIRNHEMIDSIDDTDTALCVAFPRDGSKGTKDCAIYAAAKGIEVWFPDLPMWAQWAAPIAMDYKGEEITWRH